MSRLPGEIFKKKVCVCVLHLKLSYCPLQIWALKTCNQDILKIIIASSFKHAQLTEDNQ